MEFQLQEGGSHRETPRWRKWGFLVSKKLQAEVIVITLRLFRLIVTRCFRFPRLNKNPGLVPDLFNFDLNVCTSTTFDIVPAGTKRRGISYRYFPWFFLLLYFTSAPFWSSFCPSIHPRKGSFSRFKDGKILLELFNFFFDGFKFYTRVNVFNV